MSFLSPWKMTSWEASLWIHVFKRGRWLSSYYDHYPHWNSNYSITGRWKPLHIDSWVFFFFFGIILVAFSFLLSYDNMFQLHLVHFLPQAFDQKILCKSLDVFYGEMRVELGMSILMGGSLFIDLSRGHSYEIYLCIFKDKIPCEFILITSN